MDLNHRPHPYQIVSHPAAAWVAQVRVLYGVPVVTRHCPSGPTRSGTDVARLPDLPCPPGMRPILPGKITVQGLACAASDAP
jgi:hypothetical protein